MATITGLTLAPMNYLNGLHWVPSYQFETANARTSSLECCRLTRSCCGMKGCSFPASDADLATSDKWSDSRTSSSYL